MRPFHVRVTCPYCNAEKITVPAEWDLDTCVITADSMFLPEVCGSCFLPFRVMLFVGAVPMQRDSDGYTVKLPKV